MANDFKGLPARMMGVNNLFNILMQAPDAIVISKGKEHVLWIANALAFNLMGGGTELIDKPLLEAVPTLKDTGVIESFDSVYNTGETSYALAVPVVVYPEGKEELHYFDIVYKPYYEEGCETPSGVFTISHDVTPLVEAKKKVTEIEERLKSALNAANLGSWDYDLVTDIVIASDEQKRIFGLSPEDDFSYEVFLNSIHEDDREYTNQVNQDVIHLKDGKSSYDLQYRIRRVNDGELRWVRAIGKVYTDKEGKPYRFIGMTLDITNEKKAEERTRYVFETVPLAIWDNDYSALMVELDKLKQQHGNGLKVYLLNNRDEVARLMLLIEINDANRAALTMFEAESKEQLNKSMMAVWTDETIPTFVEQLVAFANREERFHATFVMTTLKGKKIISSTTINIPQDEDFKSVIISRYDISELVQSNEDLTRFVHMISHDLKEPVRKISMYASRIQEELSEQCSESINNYLSRIKIGAMRMFSMIDGVLTYSKVNALEESFEKVDLNEVIQKVEVDLELLIQQKQAIINYGDLPQLEATPLMLHQIFYNLINNSLKFSRVEVPPEVTITSSTVVKNERACAKIVLQDNGIGFEQKYADDIFHSFTRLHTKDKYEGTGLGLFLCKTIVDRLGGTISVHSEEDKGTRFEIVLPMKR